jgi:hypothetical protein
MPKDLYTPRQLPREQPDRCELCPLVGIIPEDERRKGLRERYYCLGIFEALTDDDGNPLLDENGEQRLSFPRLKSKGITVSAKKVRDGGHLWHRPCDLRWQAWMTLPGRLFGMPTDVFTKYRQPFELEQMIKNQPRFKFRKKT